MNQAIIGYRANGHPIFRLAGSDPQGEFEFLIGDDESEDVDDGEAGELEPEDRRDSSTSDDGWPPSREEWEDLRRTAQKATKQAVERKHLLRKHGLPLRPQRDDGSQGDGDDRSAAFAEARERARRESATQVAVQKLALKAALHDAGWSGGDLALASRMVDFEKVSIEIGDDGEVIADGLDEQIDKIRSEVPTWFRRRRRPGVREVETSGASAVDGGVSGAPKPQKGWRATMSDQLGGGRR